MGRKTGKIRYNVQQRGRKHNGKDRNFDLPAMARLVNGPAVQEQVEQGDLLGYYGHWMRMKFGMSPPESIVLDGKVVRIEPAIRTTYLHADADGNIEHEAEFLDTESGRMAESLFDSKAGGFSSAIGARSNGISDIPTAFGGFDYVFEPNFTENRGYMLDSVDADLNDEVVFDNVIQEMALSTAAFNQLFDSLRRDNEFAGTQTRLAMETADRLREENEELLSLLAAHGTPNAAGIIVLDSTGGEHVRPLVVGNRATKEFVARANAFSAGTVVEFDKLPDPEAGKPDPAEEYVNAHYGIKS